MSKWKPVTSGISQGKRWNIFVTDKDNGIECPLSESANSTEPYAGFARLMEGMAPRGTLAAWGAGPVGPSGRLSKAKCTLNMTGNMHV